MSWISESKQYSYPQFRWWQFIKKRRWTKAMARISPAERIKMRTEHLNSQLPTFTDDFEVIAWIKINKENP